MMVIFYPLAVGWTCVCRFQITASIFRLYFVGDDENEFQIPKQTKTPIQNADPFASMSNFTMISLDLESSILLYVHITEPSRCDSDTVHAQEKENFEWLIEPHAYIVYVSLNGRRRCVRVCDFARFIFQFNGFFVKLNVHTLYRA